LSRSEVPWSCSVAQRRGGSEAGREKEREIGREEGRKKGRKEGGREGGREEGGRCYLAHEQVQQGLVVAVERQVGVERRVGPGAELCGQHLRVQRLRRLDGRHQNLEPCRTTERKLRLGCILATRTRAAHSEVRGRGGEGGSLLACLPAKALAATSVGSEE
jgi:hypothetical protein